MKPEVGKFANHAGYTDWHPYEIVRIVSDKTIEIREMASKLDPDWKPDIIPGGFAGHCVNNNSQEWIYESKPDGLVTKARLHKDGRWYSSQGRHVIMDKPRRFHDYNF